MPIIETWLISKAHLFERLESLCREQTVIAPVRQSDGEVSFQPIRSADEITLDYVNELHPPKRFLQPVFEPLFTYNLGGARPQLNAAAPPSPQILFGIRSCDVQGFRHMDGFFSGAFEDDLYQQRRNQTTVISLACLQPADTCFCICCNGGPYLSEGFDLQLTDLGEQFLAEVGTRKGAAIVQACDRQPAGEKEEQQRQALMQACDEKMIPTAYLAKAVIAITNQRLDEKLWEEMGLECFSCGGCTHVCPCCTCFEVLDQKDTEKTGLRFRCWDSCQYAGFTREASGHNPRAQTKERVKRRFYHKLSFAYIQADGHPGCVGCGRCITVCQAFGLLDMAAVVKRIRREGQLVADR